MHEVACIFIVVPQQKWNNTYAGTLYKLEGGVQTFVFKMKSRLILKTSHRVLEFLSSFKWCFFLIMLKLLEIFFFIYLFHFIYCRFEITYLHKKFII